MHFQVSSNNLGTVIQPFNNGPQSGDYGPMNINTFPPPAQQSRQPGPVNQTGTEEQAREFILPQRQAPVQQSAQSGPANQPGTGSRWSDAFQEEL